MGCKFKQPRGFPRDNSIQEFQRLRRLQCWLACVQLAHQRERVLPANSTFEQSVERFPSSPTLELRYDVSCPARHRVDFELVSLPLGCSDLYCITECLCAACPSGCADTAGVFNARIMWRESKTDPNQAQLMTYMYNPTKVEACGDNWEWTAANVERDVWMTQTTYIKLNTVGVCVHIPEDRCFESTRTDVFMHHSNYSSQMAYLCCSRS